jgi:hypothetical protein
LKNDIKSDLRSAEKCKCRVKEKSEKCKCRDKSKIGKMQMQG